MRSKSSQNLVCSSNVDSKGKGGFSLVQLFHRRMRFSIHASKEMALPFFCLASCSTPRFPSVWVKAKYRPIFDVIVTHRNASAWMIFGRHSADLRKILQHLSREFVWVTAVQQMMLPLPRCRCSRLEIGGQPMLVATKNMTWDAYVWLISIIMLLSLVSLRIFFRRSAWFSVVKHCRVYVARDQREAVYR